MQVLETQGAEGDHFACFGSGRRRHHCSTQQHHSEAVTMEATTTTIMQKHKHAYTRKKTTPAANSHRGRFQRFAFSKCKYPKNFAAADILSAHSNFTCSQSNWLSRQQQRPTGEPTILTPTATQTHIHTHTISHSLRPGTRAAPFQALRNPQNCHHFN